MENSSILALIISKVFCSSLSFKPFNVKLFFISLSENILPFLSNIEDLYFWVTNSACCFASNDNIFNLSCLVFNSFKDNSLKPD